LEKLGEDYYTKIHQDFPENTKQGHDTLEKEKLENDINLKYGKDYRIFGIR